MLFRSEKYVDASIFCESFVDCICARKLLKFYFQSFLLGVPVGSMCGNVWNNLTKISGNSGGISNAVRSCDNDADL